MENWTSKYRRFNTSQHLTKFILKTAAALSEERLKEIFDKFIDKAIINQPFTTNHSSLVIGVLINGEGLDSPLVLPGYLLINKSAVIAINLFYSQT
jgi:hypothetical protein